MASFAQILANKRIALMLPLGFASGLPLALTSGTLQAWLTVAGMDLKTIGIFTLVGLPYSLKFLWAPLMDRISLPWLGRRRGWMLFTDGCPGGEMPAQVGARADRVIARLRGLQTDVALFGHGHIFRVFAVRWLGLPVRAGSHFLLDAGTVSVVSYYQESPAVKRWNVRVVDGPGAWRDMWRNE